MNDSIMLLTTHGMVRAMLTLAYISDLMDKNILY